MFINLITARSFYFQIKNFLLLPFRGLRNSVGNLVGLLKENYNIDKDRIYVFGTSFGDFCTWRLVYHNPELCACAIPVMGGFDDIIEKSVYTDFERFVNVPMWAAHSSDDECVSI